MGKVQDTPETLDAAARFADDDRPAGTMRVPEIDMLPLWRAANTVREDLAGLDRAVVQARSAGATWEAVAAATGMTRQGASSRWRHLELAGARS